MTAGIREPATPAALATCARDLHAQIEPLVAKADKLRNLCDRRGREPSDGEKQRMRELSAELAAALTAALALAEGYLARPPDTSPDTSPDTLAPGDQADMGYELTEP